MTQPVMGGSLSDQARYANLGRSCVRSRARHGTYIAGNDSDSDRAKRDMHHENRFANRSQARLSPQWMTVPRRERLLEAERAKTAVVVIEILAETMIARPLVEF